MGTGYDQGCADFRGVFARCMSLHLAEADIPAQSNGPVLTHSGLAAKKDDAAQHSCQR